ncbi:MAG: hypothetical protein HGA45_12910 [Chloroflexales bacterium]|nr:hypothetical protein [Chloroflexales bacterium]
MRSTRGLWGLLLLVALVGAAAVGGGSAVARDNNAPNTITAELIGQVLNPSPRDSMRELFGYLACGCLLGVASRLGGKLPLQAVVLNIGFGMIGVLLMALIPRLGAPEDEVRAALLGNPAAVLSFYFAFLSALGYGAIQMLAPMTPEDLLPRLQRWADRALAVAGALTILGLSSATLTLSI